MVEKSSAESPETRLRAKATKRFQATLQKGSPSLPQDPAQMLQELEIHQIELELQNEELREAQLELTHSRDRYLALYHQAPVGYVIADAAGIILQVNETFGSMLATDLSKLLYQPLTQYMRASDRYQFLSRYRSFFKSPANKHLEVGLIKSDGTIIEVKLTGRHMIDDGAFSKDKTLAGQMLISISDITDRRNAERAIIRAKQEWERTFDAVPDLIVIIDSDGVIRRVNLAFADQMGVSPGACIGQRFDQTLCAKFSGSDLGLMGQLIGANDAVEVEAHNPELDAHFIISASPFLEAAGDDPLRILIFHDITNRKKAEREALKARNLESIGSLAGGIAHDFNNILVSVVGYIELAQMSQGDEIEDYLEKALAATGRAKELTSRLLTFSIGGTPRSCTTDVRPLIQEAIAANAAGTNIKTELHLGDDLHPIFADGIQIENALQSIITNACEAMPTGGTLIIDARNISIGDGNGNGIPLRPGPHVAIQICDEGGGIPASRLDQVFDPYFTTKKMGVDKGMGLGLAITYSVVKQHGGHVSIRSKEGHGTEVNLYLPAAFGKAPAAVGSIPAPAPSPPSPKSPPRFLIMEDETSLWEMLAELFKDIGCQADFAADGEEALRLYHEAKQKGLPYHGLFLDLMIRGGKGGKEVVHEILEIEPTVKAVAFSGYTTDPVFSDHRKYGFVATLKKPFHMEEFRQVAQQLLPEDGV